MATVRVLLSFAFLALGISASDFPPETDLLHNFVNPSLEQINYLRQEFGLSLLKLDDNLVSGAQSWAESEASQGQLAHSCGPCDHYSELLAEKITNGEEPTESEAVDWAMGRWFGDLLEGNEPTKNAPKAYAAMLRKPNLATFGIGLAYGRSSSGEKTVFAVARFAKAVKPRRG